MGKAMCLLVPFIELTVSHTSVLTILAITVERCVILFSSLDMMTKVFPGETHAILTKDNESYILSNIAKLAGINPAVIPRDGKTYNIPH